MHHTLTQIFFIFGAENAFLLMALALCLVFLALKGAKKERFVVFSIISFPIMYIVASIAGFLYYNPRPFVSDHIVPLVFHAADNGFPSGHMLFCAAIAAVCTPFFKKWSILLWAITIWVGVSRVYVGVHHWIDIVASLLIALIVAVLVYKSGLIEKILKFVNTKPSAKPSRQHKTNRV